MEAGIVLEDDHKLKIYVTIWPDCNESKTRQGWLELTEQLPPV